MAVADRKARHRASLRREIIDAASRLFVEDGYNRVTMRRIAARIEYSPTTIYLYFKDKQELFAAVCEETFSELTANLERLAATSGTPLARLRDSLRTYIEFGITHPDQYTVAFVTPSKSAANTAFESSIRRRTVDALGRSVQACVDHGSIRTPSVEWTTQALWAAVHGLTTLFITMRGFPLAPQHELVEHELDVLIGGLRPPSPRPAAQSRSSFID